ncbi:hypothetical protein TIFTF001_007002 [Ficus carica]|uniref:O-acyltransferase WSD1 C-terminal domain-containing protein n=1 Tax=Ficus carica TaxID=3494 RepID=A0AA88A1X0_FICCA|nr:hypothetical protein TIFTF001_007002 [Ficus carica]
MPAVVGKVGVLWYGLMFAVKMMARLLWVRDRKTAISGGDGVELWPRKIATARFCLEDMRIVKRAVGDAEPSDLKRSKPQLHWGNKFGGILLPIHYRKGGVDHLHHVRRVKVILDLKKQCMEAHFAYKFGSHVMSYLGSKAAGLFSHRFLCNTSFLISNMVGPQEDVAIGDNPVTYIRVTSSSFPHALTMHMVSYGGRAEMQILVAKDIIPDPEFLAYCFQDALLQMKESALLLAPNIKPC